MEKARFLGMKISKKWRGSIFIKRKCWLRLGEEIS